MQTGPLIQTIEEFLAARFHRGENCWDLAYFDGYAHWHLMFLPERRSLTIMAREKETMVAFPTVEVDGRYRDVASISPLSGGGLALILQPEGANDTRNYVVITKTSEGRLSLSTSVGEMGE